MRSTAPAIAAVTIGLAVAIVWHFRQAPDPSGSSAEIADDARAASATQAASVSAPARTAAPAQLDDDAERGSSAAPAHPEVAASVSEPPPPASSTPLPGEIPALPIAELIEALHSVAYLWRQGMAPPRPAAEE